VLINVANVLAGLIGVGIIFIGARAFRAPQAAVGFGIPDTSTEDRSRAGCRSPAAGGAC
jgi:hypothetical protein